MPTRIQRNNASKVALFRKCFSGRTDVYGTFAPETERARQVRAPVSDSVILGHLRGCRPYGVYLLVEDMTRALAVDFDVDDLALPMRFVEAAKNYGVASYIERSKRKGYHVWMFFEQEGMLAAKARLFARHVLHDVGMPDTEIFPKHDRLDSHARYGNYINAPLFGAFVPKGRTVFLEPSDPTRPCADQWALLETVSRVEEKTLDEIIEINDLNCKSASALTATSSDTRARSSSFGLPPCMCKMLQEGVTDLQRVSCFRLAVQLKRAGLPRDITVAALAAWARKNRPAHGKRIITEAEIIAQTKSAYDSDYRSYGCEDPAVTPYCDSNCLVRKQACEL